MTREPNAAERRAIDLARDIPVEPLDAGRRDAIRASILAAAVDEDGDEVGPARRSVRSGSAIRWRTPAVAFAAAACALLAVGAALWWARGSQPPPRMAETTYRATINARAGAQVERLSAVPDERVRLTAGLVTIDVRPLAPGERFRVLVGDAEVEVRGTSFDVRAEHDHLVEVLVHHGVVEVRPTGRPAVVLRAGDRWSAEDLAALDPPTPAPESRPPAPESRPPAPAPLDPPASPAVAPRPRAAASRTPTARAPAADVDDPTPQPEAERAFEDAWEALRNGDTDAAIEGFRAAATAAEGDALAEDATFWHAVALARAGDRRTAATTALRDFLTRFPDSPRSGEASAILGWQLVDAGDLDAAEPLFRAASTDPTPAVAASGGKGLAEIARRRAP